MSSQLTRDDFTGLSEDEVGLLGVLEIQLNSYKDPDFSRFSEPLGAPPTGIWDLFLIAFQRASQPKPNQQSQKFARGVVKILLTVPYRGKLMDVNNKRVGPIDGVTMPLLHYAAKWGDAYLVNLLLKSGADPASKDSSGKTAAEVADAAGNTATLNAIQRPDNPTQAFIPTSMNLNTNVSQKPGGRRSHKLRLNVQRRRTQRNGRSRKHRKLRKLATRRR
jgi:hypothetical protein